MPTASWSRASSRDRTARPCDRNCNNGRRITMWKAPFWKIWVLLAACGLLSSASASAAETATADWPGRVGRYVFEITRDGKPIGTQSIEIKQDGDTVTATTESTVAVRMLGVVVYRMHQVLVETYQGRRLVAL